MTDPSSTSRLPPMPEAACARNPQRFAMVAVGAALLAVAGFALIFLAALWACAAAAHELAAGSATDAAAWAQLLASGYLVCTGLLALRPSPVPLPGASLTAENAPRLFHLLEKIAHKTGVPVPGEVRLGKEMGACVVAHARCGVLGWHRRTLVLGLPLLMALDVKQLAAVIAHELANEGMRHKGLGPWLGRMRATWMRLAHRQPPAPTPWQRVRRAAGQGVAGLFLRHLLPRFNDRALVVSRHRAFAADKVARRVAGSQAAMDALVRVTVQRSYLEQAFWPEVFSRASHAPMPNVLPFRAMGQRLRAAKGHPKAPAWLALAMQRDAQAGDTHPCLRDRLARAKLSARLVKPPKHSAAELLLRESLDPLVVQMDVCWQLDMACRWGQLHAEHVTQHRLEKELQVDGEKGALHADDHLLWARAARSAQGDSAFEALLRLMLIDHPDDVRARHELGCLLIDKTDAAAAAEGAQLLRQLALEQANAHALAAARRYGQWLALEGRTDDARFWADEVRRIEHLAEGAQSALLDFDGEQSFSAPALSARILRCVSEALARHAPIQQAHLVAKTVADFPGWRFAVLVVQTERKPRWAAAPTPVQEALAALSLPLTIAVVDAADAAWATPARRALIERIRKTPGAAVLDRAARGTAAPASPSSSYMPA